MTEYIVSVIKDILEKVNLGVCISIQHNNNFIKIVETNYGTYDGSIGIIFNVIPLRTNKCSINFTVVNLDSKLKRRGLFTSIVYNLLSIDFVTRIMISSVSGSNMVSWCKKNNFKSDGVDNWFSDSTHKARAMVGDY